MPCAGDPVESPCGLLFISGATPSPLYHKHPTCSKSMTIPTGSRIKPGGLETIKTILDHEGLTWTDVVK
jgi:2-aminomuconate deaminase